MKQKSLACSTLDTMSTILHTTSHSNSKHLGESSTHTSTKQDIITSVMLTSFK